ncbi:hypothetical protein BDN71DRAFT_1415949 [Pleurotus eryngii]|uniref:DNA damage-binding protein 1 n=1 Tax=Pleurotus eryngii TaxID=5323 RepID=A0A9P6A1K7_PLEER|nr:hypothetical protein BDN71DRAFT_1415949 [Pleurotus eryngii]
MKLVTTFHQSSSILCSVKCRLASRDLEHLVVGKADRLEVYSIGPQGLNLECTLQIWGRVLALQAIPTQKSTFSNLVLMLDHPDPELIFLSYTESSAGTGELSVKKTMSLRARLPRPAEFCNDLLIDPTGKVLLVSSYVGRLKVVVLKNGMYGQDFDVTLPELNVFSIAFLPTANEDTYAIGILHMDHQEHLVLVARELSIDNLELDPQASTWLPQTVLVQSIFPTCTVHIPKLVHVPAFSSGAEMTFRGGVMVLGGRRILLYEMSDLEWQTRAKGKAKRIANKKKSADDATVNEAKEKEKARAAKKRKARAALDWPWSDVVAYCQVDETTKFLIGDSYGRLALLSLNELVKHGLVLFPIGQVSSPTTLTYLTSQVFFVGSHLGDSQLVYINPAPVVERQESVLPIPEGMTTFPPSILDGTSPSYVGKGKKRAHDSEAPGGSANEDIDMDDPDSVDRAYDEAMKAKKHAIEQGRIISNTNEHLQVVDSWKNIAPILDAEVVDLDGNGQKQVVTCSGGKATGSLNVVRNGADFRELAAVTGLEYLVGVWPIKQQFENNAVSHLVTSTSTSTSLFEYVDKTLKFVQQTGQGLVTNERTLTVANMAGRQLNQAGNTYGNSPMIIQVTKHGVHLLHYVSAFNHWDLKDKASFGAEIVATDINPSQVIVALKGGNVYTVAIDATQTKLQSLQLQTSYVSQEVSAISCVPIGNSPYFTRYIALAYWEKNVVEILRLGKGNKLESISKTPSLPAVVRSLVLHNFGTEPSGSNSRPYVLAGLGDGSVAVFAWKDNKELADKKLISLGDAPVSLSLCEVEGKTAVFAAGTQATIVSWDGRRLRDSPIMLKRVVAAARFNTPDYRSSLILANPSGLVIGNVKDLNKLHVRSVPLGSDIPRKVVHDATAKAFGVICSRTPPVRIGEVEIPSGSFKLLDEVTFENLCEFFSEPHEEFTVITKMKSVTDVKDVSVYCVGSLRYKPQEIEPTGGRLYAFAASYQQSTMQISVLASEEVNGCVYAVTVVGDLIAAAVNSAVMLFKLEASDDKEAPRYAFKKLDEWNHNYFVTSLVSFDNQLILGDHISSISLVRVEGEKLISMAKDYAPLWPVSVEASTKDTIIGSNDTLNLFTFSVCRSPRRTTLERDGFFHLGDLVTKFIRGRLCRSSLITPDASNNVPLTPEYVYVTSSGRIGVIVEVSDMNVAAGLHELQRNMAYIRKGPGEFTLAQYRAPKNNRGRSDADPSKGFLDGDFLEYFFIHATSPEDLHTIVTGQNASEGLSVPMDSLKKVLEALQAMH